MGFSIGGGSKNYQSKNIPQYEDAASSGIMNRAGVRKIPNAYQSGGQMPASGGNPLPSAYAGTGYGNYGVNEKTGQQTKAASNPNSYSYDYSQVGQQVGRDQAVSPYQKDLNLLGEANAGFRNPTKLTQSYNPATFNYAGLPEEYGNKAFASGSKDIRRQGQGDLQAIQEAIGTRRPGLLLKAGQKNQRDVAEQLAKMRNDIDLSVMDKNVNLGVQQQQDQAGENYRGYQSRSDLEKSNADEVFRYLQGLQGGAANKIGLEAGITDQERAYQDKALDYMLNLYLGSADAMKGNKGSFGISKG